MSSHVTAATKISRNTTAPIVPENPPPELLPGRQRTRGQRNDQRIVAREQQVEQHNRPPLRPDLGVAQILHTTW
ncbi:MAG: hypothetical protein WDN28_17135 [Chthoniobacter sp.]